MNDAAIETGGFTDPRAWLSAMKENGELITDGRCECTMTRAQCEQRQKSRKNFEVADDDQSAVAREFLICAGDKAKPETRCPYYKGETSEKISRCRLTSEGLKRVKETSERKRKVVEMRLQKRQKGRPTAAEKNPAKFRWRMTKAAGKWELK